MRVNEKGAFTERPEIGEQYQSATGLRVTVAATYATGVIINGAENDTNRHFKAAEFAERFTINVHAPALPICCRTQYRDQSGGNIMNKNIIHTHTTARNTALNERDFIARRRAQLEHENDLHNTKSLLTKIITEEHNTSPIWLIERAVVAAWKAIDDGATTERALAIATATISAPPDSAA